MPRRILFVRKAQIYQVPGGLHIVIPGWLNWGILVFLLWWLYLALRGIRSDLTKSLPADTNWSNIGWIALWAIHIFAVLGILVWMIAGREILSIDGTLLVLRREILGLGWSREFALGEVRNLGAMSELDLSARGKWNPALLSTSMTFQCNGKTYRFGRGLDRIEAKHVMQAIRARFPSSFPE